MATTRRSFTEKAFQFGDKYIIAEIMAKKDGSAKYRFATREQALTFIQYCSGLGVLSVTSFTLEQEFKPRPGSAITNAYFISLNKDDHAMLSSFAAEGNIEKYKNIAPSNNPVNNMAPPVNNTKKPNDAPKANVPVNQEQPPVVAMNGIQLPDPKKLQEAIEKGLASNNADYVKKVLARLDELTDKIAALMEEKFLNDAIAESMKDQTNHQRTPSEEKERDDVQKRQKQIDYEVLQLQQEQAKEQLRLLAQYEKEAEENKWAKLREEKIKEEERLQKVEEQSRKEAEKQLLAKQQAEKAKQPASIDKNEALTTNNVTAVPVVQQKLEPIDPVELEKATAYGLASTNAAYYSSRVDALIAISNKAELLIKERADLKNEILSLKAQIDDTPETEAKQLDRLMEWMESKQKRGQEVVSSIAQLRAEQGKLQREIITTAHQQKLAEEAAKKESEAQAMLIAQQQAEINKQKIEQAKQQAAIKKEEARLQAEREKLQAEREKQEELLAAKQKELAAQHASTVTQSSSANEKIEAPDPAELEEALRIVLSGDKADYFKKGETAMAKVSAKIASLMEERKKVIAAGKTLEQQLETTAEGTDEHNQLNEQISQQLATLTEIKAQIFLLKQKLAAMQIHIVIEARKLKSPHDEANMMLAAKLAEEAMKMRNEMDPNAAIKNLEAGKSQPKQLQEEKAKQNGGVKNQKSALVEHSLLSAPKTTTSVVNNDQVSESSKNSM